MVIAVEKGLDSLKNALISTGHAVVDLDDAPSADVAIYIDTPISDILPPVRVTSGFTSSGTLLISARGRSVDEIISIIHQKSYQNLF